MIKSARIAVALITLMGCVGCDQVTKVAARTCLSVGADTSFLGDTLRLQRAENPGAFLSLGEQLSPTIRLLVFTFGGSLLVCAAGVWALRSRPVSTAQSIGAALLGGGGLGNLIDRVTRNGYVTDFLNVGIGPLRTGIFNVADVALMLGVVILLMTGTGGKRRDAIGR